MMRITGARERRVSLVVRICDILTGDIITGGRDVSVISGDGLLVPVTKPDGYFVFTGYRPERVRVTSKAYRDALIATDELTGSVLRFALIPRRISGRAITVPDNAHIGFGGSGYALAEALGDTSADILLRKEDFRDVTDLYHAIITPDGAAEAVYLERNLGSGRYLLRAPPVRSYQVRGTRAIALHRTAGGQIPIPSGADTAYIMSGGIVTTKSLEGL